MDWLKSSSPDMKHLASMPSSYVNAFGTNRQKHLALAVIAFNIRHRASAPAIRVVALGNIGNHHKHLVCAASLQIINTSSQLRLFKTHDFDHKITSPHHNCCLRFAVFRLRCTANQYDVVSSEPHINILLVSTEAPLLL